MSGNSRASLSDGVKQDDRDSKCLDMLIGPIFQLARNDIESGAARGAAMNRVIRDKDFAIAIKGSSIVDIGSMTDIQQRWNTDAHTTMIDASKNLVTAGLVDPHTHLVFGGNRANEFIMRCQGKTYTEIAEAGGGIVASMRATRTATVADLTATGMTRLGRMLAAGTTTCEVKTGYGLSAESELNMLKTVYALADQQQVELVPTFMPAHAVPPGVDHQKYVDEIVSDMLPAAVSFCQEHGYQLPFIDVFCDKGYFTLDDTRKIFERSHALGFKTKVHSDEFVNLGATKLATESGCASADHLLNVSDEEIKLMSGSNTVAVLLPGTSFYLNLHDHAPARKMIDSGVAVALGSDFNPGSCHIFSLPLIWGLACLHLKMTAEEALSALTVNSAHAIGLGDRIGKIAKGYQADITVYEVPTLEEVPYNLGYNPVSVVIKKGRVVSSR